MRWSRPTIAYIDTNALIRSIESDETAIAELLEDAAADLVRLVTSEFTLAEVLVAPLKAGNERLISLYEELLKSDDWLVVVPVTRSVLKKSAEVRASLGSKTADSLHIATAILSGCEIFVSSDSRIRLPDGIKRVASTDISNPNLRP